MPALTRIGASGAIPSWEAILSAVELSPEDTARLLRVLGETRSRDRWGKPFVWEPQPEPVLADADRIGNVEQLMEAVRKWEEGRFYRAIIRNANTGGTKVLDADFTRQLQFASTFTELGWSEHNWLSTPPPQPGGQLVVGGGQTSAVSRPTKTQGNPQSGGPGTRSDPASVTSLPPDRVQPEQSSDPNPGPPLPCPASGR